MIRNLSVLLVTTCASAVSNAATTLNLGNALAPTAAILKSGGQAEIVVMGDSLSFRTGNWVSSFTSSMQSAYGNAGVGNRGVGAHGFGTYSGPNSYGVLNGDNAPHSGIDGLWRSWGTGAAGYSYIDVKGDAGTMQFSATPTGGTLTPYIVHPDNSRTYLPAINTSATANGILNYDFSGLAGNRRIYFAANGAAPVQMLGVRYPTQDAGVRVSLAANGGWGVTNHIDRDWTRDAQLQAIDPSLYVVFLGQNDQNRYTTKADYKADIDTLLDKLVALTPDAGIVLTGTWDTGGTKLRDVIIPAFEEIAAERIADGQRVGWLNIYELAGNQSYLASQGFFADGIHFDDAGKGGAHVGGIVASALRAAIVPEPASLSMLMVAGGLMLRRRHR